MLPVLNLADIGEHGYKTYLLVGHVDGATPNMPYSFGRTTIRPRSQNAVAELHLTKSKHESMNAVNLYTVNPIESKAKCCFHRSELCGIYTTLEYTPGKFSYQ